MNTPIPRYGKAPKEYYQPLEEEKSSKDEELPKLKNIPVPRYSEAPESYSEYPEGYKPPEKKEEPKEKEEPKKLKSPTKEKDFWHEKARKLKSGIKEVTEVIDVGGLSLINPKIGAMKSARNLMVESKKEESVLNPKNWLSEENKRKFKSGLTGIGETALDITLDEEKQRKLKSGAEGASEVLRRWQKKGAQEASKIGLFSAVPAGGEDERYEIIEYQLGQGEITLEEYKKQKDDLDSINREEEPEDFGDAIMQTYQDANEHLRAFDMGTFTGLSGNFVNRKKETEIEISEKVVPLEEKYNELNRIGDLFESAKTKEELEKLYSEYADDYADLLKEFDKEKELFSIKMDDYHNLPEVKHSIASSIGNGFGTIVSLGMGGRVFTPTASHIRNKILKRAGLGTGTQAILMGKGRFLQNYVPQAIGYSGPLFATHAGVVEFSEQLRNDDLDPNKLFGGVAKGYLFGLTTAAPSTIFSKKALQASFFQSINFGGWAALDTYAQKGEITKEDIPNILISAGMGFLFEFVSGRQIRDAYHKNEVGFFSQTLAGNHIKSRSPNLSNKKVTNIVKTQSRLSTELFYTQQSLKKFKNQLIKTSNPKKRARLQQLVDETLKIRNNLQTRVNEINVKYNFKKDTDFVIKDGKAVIVDQSTGRLVPERHWRDFIQGRHFEIRNNEIVPIEWRGAKFSGTDFAFGTISKGVSTSKNVTQISSAQERMSSMITNNFISNAKKTSTELSSRLLGKSLFKGQSTVLPTSITSDVKGITKPDEETTVMPGEEPTKDEFVEAQRDGDDLIQEAPEQMASRMKSEGRTFDEFMKESGFIDIPKVGDKGTIKIENLVLPQDEVNAAISNIEKGLSAQTEGPVKVVYDPKVGRLEVADGYHRVVEAMNRGEDKIDYTVGDIYETGTKAEQISDITKHKDITKSQLKDIWNQEQATSDLAQEARKEEPIKKIIEEPIELTQKEKKALDMDSAAQYADSQKDVINLMEKYENASEQERASISQKLEVARAKHENFWREAQERKSTVETPEEPKKPRITIGEFEKLPYESQEEAFSRLSEKDQAKVMGLGKSIESLEKAPKKKLFDKIIELGGIKTDPGIKEEIAEIPLRLRKNTGQAPNEMAELLKEQGWNIEDGNELIDAITKFERMVEPGARKKTRGDGLSVVERVQKRDDTIQKLYDGEIKVRPDNQKNKEYIESAVGDRAEDIISTNPEDMTFSEFAKSIDIEPGKLLKELLNRDDGILMDYKIETNEINKRAKEEAKKAIYKKYPYVKEVEKIGDGKWGWNDLKKEDVAAVIYWHKLGNKEIPMKVKEYYDNKYPMRRELSTPKISESKDVSTLEGRFETQLNLRINNNAAIRKLIEINKYLHKNSKIKLTEKTSADGYYRPDSNLPLIAVKDINGILTMAHETFHNFDHTIGKDDKKGIKRKLSTRIGAPSEIEEKLQKELKDVSFYVRPYDREGASEKYKKYRNSPVELFAQWGALWVNDREKALELAPTFTVGMEAKYGEHLNNISNIYSNIEAEHISPYVKPVKEKMDEIKSIWKIVNDSDKSIKEKGDDVFNFKNVNIRFWRALGIPSIRGLSDELFRNVYRAFVDKSVYEANRIRNKLTEYVDFKNVKKFPEFVKEEVTNALYRGNEKSNQKYFTEDELRSPTFGFNDDAVKLYKQFESLFRTITKVEVERVKRIYGFYELDKETQAELKPVIEAKIKKNQGWVPLKRQETKWMVTAKKQTEADEIPFMSFNNSSEAEKYKETLTEMGYKGVVSFRPIEVKEGFMDDYGADLSIVELDSLISSAGVESSNPEVDKIKKELEKLKSDKDAWLNKPIIKRRWVPGYHRNFDNLLETSINQIKETSSRYGRSVGLAEARRELKKIDRKKNPESFHIGLSFLSNLTHASEPQWENARKVVYLFYLGTKFSHLVQNFGQRWILSGPWAAKYVGFANSYKIGAQADVIEKKFWSNKYTKTKFKIDKEIETAINRGIKDKSITGAFAEEVFGAKHRSRSKTETVIGSVSIVSDTSNRAHSMIMAILIAKQIGIKGKNARYKFAREFIETTQILYGNHNAPGIIADSGKIKSLVRFLYIFRTFALYDLQLGAHILIKEPGAVKSSWLLNRMVVAGLKGLVPLFIIDRLINYFTGKSPVRWLRSKATEVSSDFAQLVFDGVPSMMGMNMSQLMNWGGLYNPNFNTEDQILGAGWGIRNNVLDAIDLWQHGKRDEALEAIAPSSAKNMLVGKRWEEEGIFEVGKYVKIEPSKWEITQKKLGFTPQRVAMAYNFTGIVREYEKERGKIRGNVMKIIKDGEVVSEEMWERIKKHNENVEDDILLLDYTKELEIPLKKQSKLFDSLQITTDKVKRWADEARKEEKINK